MTKQWLIAWSGLLASACAILPLPTQLPVDTLPTPLQFANPIQSGSTPPPVTVSLSRDGDSVTAHFKVSSRAIAAKAQLARNEYPYDFDVVELFVRNALSSAPGYFEFEVSPYNQSLQVNVVDPRQEYHFGVRNGFTHSATIVSGGWEAEMKIPLASIGWNGREPVQLVGNAYAALGEGDQRVYWSLFELPAGKPDFHAPSAFRPLFAGLSEIGRPTPAP